MKYVLSILLAMCLWSCKDNIDFEYHSTDPMYVVEGRVTNTDAAVSVSMSQDMESTSDSVPVNDARVIITGDDGSMQMLQSVGYGKYVAEEGFCGKKGVTYTLQVNVGGNTFQSSSTMQDTTKINALNFTWEKVMNEEILGLHVNFDDIKNDSNYYCLRVYRNDTIYMWNVMKDMGYENQCIDRTLTMITKSKLEKNKDEDHDKMVYEGDRIRLQLLVIDKRTYDYLTSLRMSTNNRSNPYLNFGGLCMGYFSAYGMTEKEIIYNAAHFK